MLYTERLVEIIFFDRFAPYKNFIAEQRYMREHSIFNQKTSDLIVFVEFSVLVRLLLYIGLLVIVAVYLLLHGMNHGTT